MKRLVLAIVVCLALGIGMCICFTFCRKPAGNGAEPETPASPPDTSQTVSPDRPDLPGSPLPLATPLVPVPEPVTAPADKTGPTRQQPATAAPVPETSDQTSSPAVAAAVVRFRDPAIPIEKRMKEVKELATLADPKSIQTLMALGSTDTYLNYVAIEALGGVKTPEVALYLEGKVTGKDPRILSNAVLSLAKVQGPAAVPVISNVLASNRQRPDGFQDVVCGSCVKAFGEIRSPAAIPALVAEFTETVGKTLHHEYGSQVVAALREIHDRAAIPGLEAYAQRLQTAKDGMADNPMGQRYMEAKIAEVKAAINEINGNGNAK